jgi:tetratricopeptide (TPR) repeat protein
VAECEHLGRTSAYFDGELPSAEHADAVAHLATCEECQRVLGTAVSLDAAIGDRSQRAERPKPVDELQARRTRRRWPLVAAVGAIAAAAVLLFWLVRPTPKQPQQVALELPPERAVAVRFTGDAFAKHRPYGALRGDTARESISLATLAALEKRGELHDLVAALTSTGDVGRARELAAKLPDDARSESDRAAIALAGREREQALAHVYRALGKDRELTAAWWNLALIARDLGLPRVAKDAFEHVIAKNEPGWAEEARKELVEVERQIAAEDSPDIEKRAKEMLTGGPVLDGQDVQRSPTVSRFYFYDGLRVAMSKVDVERLRPLAAALDTASGLSTATAALERVAAADFAVRAKIAPAYRALVLREPGVDHVKLVDDLKKLGKPVEDIYVGACILTLQTAKRIDELRAIAKPWNDPWSPSWSPRSIAVRIPRLRCAAGSCPTRSAHCSSQPAVSKRPRRERARRSIGMHAHDRPCFFAMPGRSSPRSIAAAAGSRWHAPSSTKSSSRRSKSAAATSLATPRSDARASRSSHARPTMRARSCLPRSRPRAARRTST